MPEHISGTVRFSVESLLYYAPKVISTARTLASAVDMAQRQLLGLGDFFGESWPDEPFRNSYPRCQYAMLIIARQLADEIQGIGGGIEQMAATYGITENQNTADVARIQSNQSQTNMLLYHTGGLPAPPETPLNMPVPPTPQGPLPHPQANPAPAASTPVPAATLSSYISTASTPGPTPSPQPGVDPTSWHQSDPFSLLGPWPSGDPARMEEAANCWSALQSALDTAWTDLQRYTAYILADAQGAAADAFNDYVDGLTATGGGSLTRAIQTVEDLHDVCLRQAQEIRVLRTNIEQTAIELAAAFVVGQVVSMLTFETTQALSDAIDAGLAARLGSWVEGLVAEGTRLAELLNTAAEGLSKAVSSAFASGLQSAAIGSTDLFANNMIGRAFGAPPVTGTKALLNILEAGGVGAIFGQGSAGGLLGLSAGAASKKLIDMGEVLQKGAGDSKAASALIGIGRQLKDGGITVSAANSALTQLLTQHEITPVTFVSSAISNRFTTAISPSTGSHARH